ncbi:UvrD-like helicase family protein [Tamaricihabitans halophyticus]|uniref:UvrD-like helicase family protein n=1 Tax=Tamaricihabitans halophyticus TaxID=1262583 RepID=A0A4R2QXZ8_9PSEU|nr:ATP-binding domain-containing protein [Tamaricihabitans halophyticus]TCP52025.1 UvrD-like helicase family protein [Tamaricihabitans halophyticus]
MSQDTPHPSARDAEIAIEQRQVSRVYERLDQLRGQAEAMRDRGYEMGHGATNEAVFEQASMLFERDMMVFHANQLLQALDSEYEGLVFGRLDDIQRETTYVGRLGVRDAEFNNLVTDWRAPAAAPFYQARPEEPMDVVRRRVIRCTAAKVQDVDDDVLIPSSVPDDMRVVGEGALMAALGKARGEKMRDIVATIQREQDEAIRAPWRGVTEITGGPGTGKTAVALHRAAYLLYRNRRQLGGAGVLVIGPSPVFTDYISRVLPSMGETNVELRSLGEVLDGSSSTRHDPASLAALKGSLRMRRVLKRALRAAPPDAPTEMRIVYAGEVLKLDATELAKVRKRIHSKITQPNRSRVRAAEILLEALWDKAESYVDDRFAPKREQLITDLGERIDFHRFLVTWWQILTPEQVLTWLSDRKNLASAAGKAFTGAEINALADSFRQAFDEPGRGPSVADIALLDELRVLLGPPPKRRRRGQQSPLNAPEEPAAGGRPANYDEYSHIVVDEAQDLSPMQWRMVGRRGRYASWTVVGDPVQSSWPDETEAAQARESAFGASTKRRRFALRTNYRNSAEIFAFAARVVRDIATPDELPNAVRSTEVEPRCELVRPAEFAARTVEAAREHLAEVDGTVGVITAMDRVPDAEKWVAAISDDRLRVVGSLEAKGLEYDAVVVVEPTELITETTTGPRALYVALTRATQRLTVICSEQTWLKA